MVNDSFAALLLIPVWQWMIGCWIPMNTPPWMTSFPVLTLPRPMNRFTGARRWLFSWPTWSTSTLTMCQTGTSHLGWARSLSTSLAPWCHRSAITSTLIWLTVPALLEKLTSTMPLRSVSTIIMMMMMIRWIFYGFNSRDSHSRYDYADPVFLWWENVDDLSDSG